MRQPSEDELAYYREEANRERFEREQQQKWINNQSKHVLDPDRVEEEGEEE